MTTATHGVFNPIYKQEITQFLTNLLKEKLADFSKVNTWGNDVTEKLVDFTSQGKMIRGSLVLFIYEVYAGKINAEAIKTAAALELFHSALLIHDDIMDNDRIRRGNPTIFAQYQTFAEEKQFSVAHHFGESMGISVGDIAFFLGFQLLNQVNNREINALCMQEMTYVGLAQMQDVYHGYIQGNVTEEEIEKVYLYKTGRYTFSLPMMMGALLAGETETVLLEKLGESAGLLFQYTDDKLSIFGQQKETGKIEGSDIREDKKTLYRHYLFQKTSGEDKKIVERLFGKKELHDEDIETIREMIRSLHIQDMMDEKIEKLQNQAKAYIIQLQLPENHKQSLTELVESLKERNV